MSAEILIVGAGAAGLSAALALSRRENQVTVADAGHAGQSSWAGAGIVCPLLPWHYGEDMNRLALAGMRAWPQWAAAIATESGIDPEFWACGMEVAGLAENQTALAWCEAHHLAAQAWPQQRLWLPEVAQVRNPRLVRALAGAVQAGGGRLLQDTPIQGLRRQGRRITAAVSGQAEYSADAYILATGAWAGLTLEQITPAPHIRPVRGQMLLYAPGSHTLTHIVYRDGLYLVPRRDGHLLAGSTLEDAGFDAQPDEDTARRLHQAACALLPELAKSRPIRAWAGLRPGSPDNLPLIGRHPDFDNLWLHTGHFRYGVTMAPASSGLLAELMLGETPSLDPAPYSWQAAESRAWPNGKPC